MLEGLKNVLNPDQMSQLNVLQGKIEQISWKLYDIQSYAAGGATQFRFFNRSLAGTTLSDTNLTLPGQLPAQNFFVIQRMSVELLPAVAAITTPAYVSDQLKALQRGNLSLVIGSKQYRQVAPAIQACDNRLTGFAAAGEAAVGNNVFYAAPQTAVKEGFDPWVLIPPTLNFNVDLNYPEGAQAISAAGRIACFLYGYLIRPVQ